MFWRVLVVVLLAVGFAGEGDAKRRPRDRIAVYDYLPYAAEVSVRGALDLINSQTARAVPRLVYHRMEPTECEATPRKRGIVLCETPHLSQEGIWADEISWTLPPAPVEALLRFHPERWILDPVLSLCHELCHAVVKPENHDGWTDERPCPFDEALARSKYLRAIRRS